MIARWIAAASVALAAGCGDNLAVPVDAMPPFIDAPSDQPPWSLVVLPDTQEYAVQFPDILVAQTRWIADNAEALRIRYVLHVGDVTEGNSPEEWAWARYAFDELDGVVPLVVVPGNHDYAPDQERYSGLTEWVPVSKVEALPGFAGLFEGHRVDNSAHTFEVDGERWLILALEWGPRDQVLDWAADVLDSHPEHQAIVLTHAYLFSDGTRYDWAGKGATQTWSPPSYPSRLWPDVNDGEEIWLRLIEPRDQVRLVVCGHAAGNGVARLTSKSRGGTSVHQLLANYQDYEMGGGGYLRIMRFFPDRIEVRTYSPWLDLEYDDGDNRFALLRDP